MSKRTTARQPIYTAEGDASGTTGALTSLLGVEAMTRLSDKFGGRRIYVPATIGPDHPLAVAAGLEAALQLVAHYAGHTLSLPITPARRQRVLELDKRGFTKALIAETVGLTERRVYQILAEQPAVRDDTQGSLF
ncbi:MAG: hypothetical protein GC145_14485 [Caulobacter sp.]|nr:hypothetical protein [Caulobacter sp.]